MTGSGSQQRRTRHQKRPARSARHSIFDQGERALRDFHGTIGCGKMPTFPARLARYRSSLQGVVAEPSDFCAMRGASPIRLVLAGHHDRAGGAGLRRAAIDESCLLPAPEGEATGTASHRKLDLALIRLGLGAGKSASGKAPCSCVPGRKLLDRVRREIDSITPARPPYRAYRPSVRRPEPKGSSPPQSYACTGCAPRRSPATIRRCRAARPASSPEQRVAVAHQLYARCGALTSRSFAAEQREDQTLFELAHPRRPTVPWVVLSRSVAAEKGAEPVDPAAALRRW